MSSRWVLMKTKILASRKPGNMHLLPEPCRWGYAGYLEEMESADAQAEVVIDPRAMARAPEKLRPHPEPEARFLIVTESFAARYRAGSGTERKGESKPEIRIARFGEVQSAGVEQHLPGNRGVLWSGWIWRSWDSSAPWQL